MAYSTQNNTQLQSDWKSNPFWDTTQPGQSVNYGNGSLIRNADGSATYKATGDQGSGYTFDRNQSTDSIANGSKDIANIWAGKYGIKDIPQTDTNTNGVSTSGQTQLNVTPGMSVADRVKGIISDNSPLMQQAAAKANQASNDRGLINSSIAVGSAQGAVMDRAIPMASQDASTEANAAQFNAGQANQMSQFNAAQLNQAENQKKALQFQASENLAARMQQSSEAALGRNFTAEENALNRTASAQLATTASQYTQLLQGSSNATSIMNTAQGRISDILTNQQLDAPAKQVAIDIINRNAQAGLAVVGALAGDVNLSNYLDQILA